MDGETGAGAALSAREFGEQLRQQAGRRYHHRHPFHVRMHEGRLSPDEIRAWVKNRYYYQTRIPLKDALIVAKSEDPAFRREWLRRVTDHDGMEPGSGGIELWERLGDAVGVDRSALRSFEGVLPGVRFACDAYVSLVRDASLVAAVASSLTEAFASELLADRVLAFERHYSWIDASALEYFRSRVPRARRDSETALAFVLANATTSADQRACLAALLTKTDILWHLLDCVEASTRLWSSEGARA
jgi:pyrroloquinoline-quinone synthase